MADIGAPPTLTNGVTSDADAVYSYIYNSATDSFEEINGHLTAPNISGYPGSINTFGYRSVRHQDLVQGEMGGATMTQTWFPHLFAASETDTGGWINIPGACKTIYIRENCLSVDVDWMITYGSDIQESDPYTAAIQLRYNGALLPYSYRQIPFGLQNGGVLRLIHRDRTYSGHVLISNPAAGEMRLSLALHIDGLYDYYYPTTSDKLAVRFRRRNINAMAYYGSGQ